MNRLSLSHKPSFGSGLNGNILNFAEHTKVFDVENMLHLKFHINATFKQNQNIAFMNIIATNIFEKICRTLRIKRFFYNKNISVYDRHELLEKKLSDNFCMLFNKKEKRTGELSKTGDLFFLNKNCSLISQNNITEELYSQNTISTNHFMSSTIHEWVHSLHVTWLKDRCCQNDNKYLSIIERFSNKLPTAEREQIETSIGKYGTLSPFEFVAETLTKQICASLNDKLALNTDLLNKFPNAISVLLKKYNSPIY